MSATPHNPLHRKSSTPSFTGTGIAPAAGAGDHPHTESYAHTQHTNHTNHTSDQPSRQFLTAQKLKVTGAKVWACDRCYRLKNKCDSQRPSCAVCKKGNHECTYERKAAKAKTLSPAPDDPNAAATQLPPRLRPGAKSERGSGSVNSVNSFMNGAVQMFQTSMLPDPMLAQPVVVPTNTPYMELLQTRLYEVEEAARSMSAPEREPLLYQLENTMHTMNVHHPHPQQQQPPSLTTPPYAYPEFLGPTGLPPPPSTYQTSEDPVPQRIVSNIYSALPSESSLFSSDVILYLVHTFFREIAPAWYPNPIHEATFMAAFNEQSPLLIFAMCAAAARRSDHPITRAYVASKRVPLYQAGEPYLMKAKGMITRFRGPPTFETVVALVTMGVAAGAMGDVDLSVQLMTMGIQTALNLRLDTDPDQEEVHGRMTWLQKESRRRLWWTLCMYDRQPKPGLETVAAQNVPPMIGDASLSSPDQFCFNGVCTSPSTNPPVPDQLWLSVTDQYGEPNPSTFQFGLDVDFGALSGRLAKVFYKIQNFHQSLHGCPDPSALTMHSLPFPVPCVTSPCVKPDPAAAQTTENLLAVELQAIMGSLPDWARDIDDYKEFSPDITSRTPPPWQLLTQHIVYHALNVCLFLPSVLAHADALRGLYKSTDGGHTPSPFGSPSQNDATPPPPPPTHITHAYHRCRYHATSIASHLRRLMSLNPTARWVDWYTLYLAFRSALVFVVVLKTEVDREELVHARRDLEIHLAVMRSVGRHLWFARWITTCVEGIIMEA
ncbi:uncharacterized protein EV422DRAFT_540843 [Fimicolochytrium jonesii]|uniref:uncharacterized protein n=1 Tax=Fimicolochytrium jonesii TaxID=1396493 RepID=UPI0022FEB572|nr:uncharacterized protein EV422DRAFT_540843 [Fimicolochytrium jonesii]KAI8817759.1 hypothetical protein EV422DRAFT_540843 [Fimicolochytrium jonesii]